MNDTIPTHFSALQGRMHKILTESFCAADIAEPLCSFDGDKNGAEVAQLLKPKHVPVVGVRIDGALRGVVPVDALDARPLSQQIQALDTFPIVSGETSFAELIPKLDSAPFCLVRVWSEPMGVVVKNDIQKPPVRMWLFGMVTIVELFITRAVAKLYPEESWQKVLSTGRLEGAQKLQGERQRRGQHVELIECLQLKDKTDLLLRHPQTLAHEDFQSKGAMERMIKQLESLRNNLAHAQDIVAYDWDTIVIMAGRVERIVGRLSLFDSW